MKRQGKGGRVIYTGQPVRVVLTLGDGLVFDAEDVIEAAFDGTGAIVGIVGVKTSDNTVEFIAKAEDMGHFGVGNVSVRVIVITAAGKVASTYPIGELVEGVGISTRETRVAVTMYVKDVAPLFIPEVAL